MAKVNKAPAGSAAVWFEQLWLYARQHGVRTVSDSQWTTAWRMFREGESATDTADLLWGPGTKTPARPGRG